MANAPPLGTHLIPFDGSLAISSLSTAPPPDAPKKKECEAMLEERIKEMQKLQVKLYADDRFSLLLIFQAMDAAGKDGTIRAVMSGVDPAGCQVFNFKSPSSEELDHDFLWRTSRCLPERGRIGIFNRSYYEEVLVVRVHPEYLAAQRLPAVLDAPSLWEERYESIRDHERHLARNGTVILKFFLHVSKEEQKERLLARIEEAKSNWKFNVGDVAERARWDEYMQAYQSALSATSRPWAPWYAIPADNKSYMRLAVCETIVQKMASLGVNFPTVGKERLAQLADMKRRLADEAL